MFEYRPQIFKNGKWYGFPLVGRDGVFKTKKAAEAWVRNDRLVRRIAGDKPSKFRILKEIAISKDWIEITGLLTSEINKLGSSLVGNWHIERRGDRVWFAPDQSILRKEHVKYIR